MARRWRSARCGLLDRTGRRMAATGERRGLSAIDAAERFLLHLDRPSWFASVWWGRCLGLRSIQGFKESFERFPLRTSQTVRHVLACHGRIVGLFVHVALAVVVRRL